ncbi:bifunctional diguanylate cyclase/phosphodiesterase [Halopseudomonas sp.]|uniref:bifunctional diguanylate cyclase/phosphodiesterase n=1 Tax=Halopseudomonas sp. TaxID=2901191 RepID=UPI00300278E1
MADQQNANDPGLPPAPRIYRLAALLTGLIIALLAFVLGYSLHQYNRVQYEQQFVQGVQSQGEGIADFVQRSLGAVYTLGTLVEVSNGAVDEFQLLGQELSSYFPGASILALARGGVISHVWPDAAGVGELGRDLLRDPQRSIDAMTAVQNKSLTLSKPFELAAGGRAIAGRLPVFVSDRLGKERFWGFAIAVIDLSRIRSLNEIQTLYDQQLHFSLWHIDSLTGQRTELFSHAAKGDPGVAHEVSLGLPNAHWVLRVEQPPMPGHWLRMTLMTLLGLFASIALGYAVLLVLNMRWQRQNLAELVEQRTRSALDASNEMAAIVHAVPDLLFEMDVQGRYYRFFSQRSDLMPMPFDSIRGRTAVEVLPAAAAEQVMAALSAAERDGWASGYSFLLSDGQDARWFELSVARKASQPSETDRFIVLSRDITQRKVAEEHSRQLLARYRSFVSASNTGAWEYQVSTGRLELSDEYFLMLGLDPAEQHHDPLYGSLQVWVKLLHPEDRETATAYFTRYLSEPTDSLYENRFRVRNAAGEWKWILARGRFLRDEHGGLSDLIVGTHIDIDATVRAGEELELVGRVFEQSSEGVLITDASQRIIKVNQAFTQITGYSAEEAMGQTPAMLSSGRHDKTFYQQMWDRLAASGHWQGEVWNRRQDGTIYPEWLSISRMLDEQGNIRHYVAVLSDITQRKADEQHIHRLAHFDTLTGLPNRTMFEERAGVALGLAARHHKQLALMFLDLDNFKNINDTLGHQVGDALLIAFAQRLSDLLREEDILSRTGGDEFTLILPEIDANGAAHTAQRIASAMAAPLAVAGHDLTVTVSIGITLYPDDAEDLSGLQSKADIAMYRAKQEGRAGYCFFKPELQTYYLRTLQIENALRQALALNQLSVYFQPQHSLVDDTLVGAEALLRWQHPELGFISPAEFIPVAERTGLITPIGEWVLAQSLSQLRSWHAMGYPGLRVAVNLSAVQFREGKLVEKIEELLESSGVPAQSLELELTESMTMHDPESAIRIIAKLNKLGLRLALDDFGTGYSSLSYLKRFHLHKLKIDQSFIRELSPGGDDAAIVNATIMLARNLGMTTLAEGVETVEQRDFLRAAGCGFVQGYLYSRPLPDHAFVDYLSQFPESEI